MKILIITLFIILINVSVYANEIFTDRELKELQVVEVNVDKKVAWIQDTEGIEAEILIGDTIGAEKGTVTEIDNASITIQTGNTRTRMPLVYGFER